MQAQFREGVYSLKLGTALGVTPIVLGAAVNIKCLIRNLSIKSPTENQKINTGCGPQANITKDLQELEFEVLIDKTAAPLQGVGADIRLLWIEMTFEPDSSFVAPYVFTGVVTNYEMSGDADQNYWVEKIMLTQVSLA
jgi:hypothetical protein